MVNDKLKFLGKKLSQLDLVEFYATLEAKEQENPELFEYIYKTVSDSRWEDQSIKQARAGFVELIKMDKAPSSEKKSPRGPVFMGAFPGGGKPPAELMSLLERVMGLKEKSEDDMKEEKESDDKVNAMPDEDKLRMLMNYVHELGIKDADEAFNTLTDRMHKDKEFFDVTARCMHWVMKDDHYKSCNCVKVKFEALLRVKSYKEAGELLRQEEMKGGNW